ncbi:LuxR C-terminal-related transcriptional regulator [Marinomonas colpomeniae]|uniref:HTH luxR-type domain-containing protein n=1 Tax=Marinomonas colpomeniae TaxID=2774408 RepID=A0ABR8P223_9GAMM|nr:LuxR C-terminal-related transcriptional regulator [Marinomonas colpomeniae]MBD5770812.1 hypothetical protein [Marinomonas colpomeniae]
MNRTQTFTELLYETITNINVWQDVLKHACKITHASKGMIVLRGRRDAELFISEKLYIELKSPMLYGFSTKEIKAYVMEYSQCDPWGKITIEHHPIRPYAVSKYLPIQELQKTKFWEWIKPQEISDSVTVEIHGTADVWVSINLFFNHNNEEVRQSSLALLQNFQKIMYDVWRLGLQFRNTNSFPESLIYFLEQQNSASIIIDRNLNVFHTNKKADLILLDSTNSIMKISNHLLIRNKEKHKNLRESVSKLSNKLFNPKKPPYTAIQLDNWVCTATLLSEGQNIVGEDTALCLLTISSKTIKSNAQLIPVWENSILTRRESQLVKVLALGGMVVDFQNEYGIAKSTAHAHWGNIKKKLEIVDRAQIFAKHQIFLEN